MWSKYPYRYEYRGNDTGIDTIILTKSGKYRTVQ
ncbi:MAG: hypothetical protein LBH02_01935 [Methanocalculaceae archaeon]|nr:hypothetical protein [Methanocalculaceae archaeon]